MGWIERYSCPLWFALDAIERVGGVPDKKPLRRCARLCVADLTQEGASLFDFRKKTFRELVAATGLPKAVPRVMPSGA